MSKAAELAALIGSQTALSNRNLIINGAMQVAQRGTSETGVTTGGYYTLDRFSWLSSMDDTVTLNQSSQSPEGFANSFHVDVTAADTDTSGGSDRAYVYYTIEAQDLQHLEYGTASAKTMALSFWVRSSVTGTYAVGFYQNDSGRLYSKNYTVNTADTWEQKSITISSDASGQINNDNGAGLTLYFWLAANSGYTTGSGDTWSTSNTEWAAGHNVNVLGDAANDFYITGVQLEVGEQATPFEHRSFGDELIRCGRYYQKWADVNWTLAVEGTRNSKLPFQFSTLMRANPTCAISGGSAASGALAGTGVTDPKKEMVNLHFWRGVSGGLVNGSFTGYTLTADAEL